MTKLHLQAKKTKKTLNNKEKSKKSVRPTWNATLKLDPPQSKLFHYITKNVIQISSFIAKIL